MKGNKVLEVLAKNHDDWIKMAGSFGLNSCDVEDIVQEMYVCVDKAVSDVSRIMYSKDKVNTFYIYTTLKHLHWQNFHKAGNIRKRIDLRYSSELKYSDSDDDLSMYKNYMDLQNSVLDEFDVDYKEKLTDVDMFNKIKTIYSDWHWYDKKIFDLYFKDDMSMRQLASKTKISLSSIFNTIDNCRDKLKNKMKKDWDNYDNY